jgi:phosphate ABC transporter phosphate-binding protein
MATVWKCYRGSFIKNSQFLVGSDRSVPAKEQGIFMQSLLTGTGQSGIGRVAQRRAGFCFRATFGSSNVRRGLITFLSLVCLTSGCARSDRALTGTGSTFVGPLLDKWSQQYQSTKGVKVVYDPIGSGIGFDRWKGGLFDFSCTDAPLTDEQVGEAKANRGDVLHIPLAIGAVVPVYNVEGVDDLVVNGEVLSEIYQGIIRKWNDPKLEELNTKGKLPDQDIIVVHRQDASGTTYIWTNYLHTVHQDKWKATTRANWAQEVKLKDATVKVNRKGAFGNAGLAAEVKNTPFSIGYVSLQEANARKLSFAKITPSHDRKLAVTADATTVAASVNLAAMPDDLRTFAMSANSIENGWPIWGTTFAIVSVNPTADRAETLRNFLTWATHDDGQKIAEDLHYVRLPKALVAKVEKKIEEIKGSH